MSVTLYPTNYIMDAAQRELNSSHVDLSYLIDLMTTINMFSNQEFAHEDRMDHCKYTREYQEKLKAVVAGHVSYLTMACIIAAGLGTLYGAQMNYQGVLTNSKSLESFGQGAMAVGNSVQSGSQIFNSYNASNQELNQAQMKEMEQKGRNVEEDAKRHDNQALSAYESARKMRELILQFFLQL